MASRRSVGETGRDHAALGALSYRPPEVSRTTVKCKEALIGLLSACANQNPNLPEVALLISVAGLHVSAGMMASSRPGIGHEPKSGLWGADEGAKLYAVRGPVEHQASLTSELTIALDCSSGIECRVVGRFYFRLRLDATQAPHLQFFRKRYATLGSIRL
jgi:hypothetical protein